MRITMSNRIDLNNVESIGNSQHTSSTLQPDTLFHFMEKVEWLIDIIVHNRIPARYCNEDVKYLKIKNINYLSIPMRCFCDIKLHQLGDHIDYYGACGIAFPKEWGMKNYIQPIHYLNPDSKLAKEATMVFSDVMNKTYKRETVLQRKLKSFIYHQLLYYKPYSGKSRNRRTKKEDVKCFTDECEWRYVPDLSSIDYPPFIINDGMGSEYINKLNDSLREYNDVALKFNYQDIKYLIVENQSDFNQLIDSINRIEIPQSDKIKLVSKIIIWDEAKGDF